MQVTSEPITIDDVAADQEVYISGCVGATIIITKKVKTITVDSCKRSKIVFDGAISSLEVLHVAASAFVVEDGHRRVVFALSLSLCAAGQLPAHAGTSEERRAVGGH